MSHRSKLGRAEEHLERLEQSVKRWKDSNPYSFPSSLDLQTREKVVYLKLEKPFPEEWSLMAGDVLFNMRAALDHLAFALNVKGKAPVALSEGEIRSSQFPIYGDKVPSTSKLDSLIGCMDSVARTIIEDLQPYKHTDYREHFLWALSVLNNVDKHRTLHVAATAKRKLRITGVRNLHVGHIVSPDEFLNDGSELARFGVMSAQDPTVDGEVSMEWDMLECWPMDMPPGAIIPVDQGLRFILERIRAAVLPPLEPFLC